jgi:3-oxoacyl-[acyl-carrier protein] reductase
MPSSSPEFETNAPRGIVVTGSSSGIGRAIAQRLARPGVSLLIHGVTNREGVETTARHVRDMGADAEVLLADLATPAGRAALLAAAARFATPIACWVHCAGVDVLTTELRSASFADKFDRLWEVDVRGTMLLAREAAVALREEAAANRSMVFLGWDQAGAGMEGEAGQMFGPIKAAVTSFAMHAAQDWAPDVRVNVVAPGWIRTAWGETTDAYWDRRARQSALLSRWGRPEDVAGAVAFLTGPEASFISGQILDVNGGWNRRFDRETGLTD